ncbi:MAG: FAD-dependent oxidoreductase [Pseudomonadales bacterium]|nr:FAD-dependent oxidoreductase [Pseudomonadales bacterium]
MTIAWDEETDLVVIGAGAAGMTAALSARAAGLSVQVLEKTEQYGGTTALSGGVLWAPGHGLDERGRSEVAEQVLTYLRHNVGNRVADQKLVAFVREVPHMLALLTRNDFVRFESFASFPDYRPETPGGVPGGRSVEPRVFAGKRLGAEFPKLRRRAALAPGGIVGTMGELRKLAEIRANPMVALAAWRAVARSWWGRLTGAEHLSGGAALAAWLRHALLKSDVPVRLSTALRELVCEDGRVAGVVVESGGRALRLRARRGVVIAAGGFEHNADMRRQYDADATSEYTSGAPGNTGDAIRAGQAIGAAVDLMEDAWWAPTFLPPGGAPQIVIFERAKPGNIIVDAAGNRFANEALPYNDLVKQMQEANRHGAAAIPSFFVFDARYRERYPLAGMLPGITPQRHIDSGFMARADSLAALAGAVGIDAAGLVATVERFNAMAVRGVDEDFHRGESAFDRFSGDPSVGPNTCLAPLDKPPFYAMKLWPGDLGTKGGLLTNEHAEVLRPDGSVIAGLYAAGNSSASIMGHFYPGAGGTIGPAMTWGYIAAQRAAEMA